LAPGMNRDKMRMLNPSCAILFQAASEVIPHATEHPYSRITLDTPQSKDKRLTPLSRRACPVQGPRGPHLATLRLQRPEGQGRRHPRRQ
jgi:hypothetical protein